LIKINIATNFELKCFQQFSIVIVPLLPHTKALFAHTHDLNEKSEKYHKNSSFGTYLRV